MDIPAPTEKDTPFRIRDVLTIYEAAMVYAGRHPYPHFFAVKNSSIEDHLQILQLGLSNNSASRRVRAQAQRSLDICCELVNRVGQGIIKSVKRSYDQDGKIDLRRTRIQTSELVELADERRERPKYLRHLLGAPTAEPFARTKHKNRQRGPARGTTGFQDQDEKLFPEMAKLIKRGEARSAFGAALILAHKGKIAGAGSSENKARRVSARYREMTSR